MPGSESEPVPGWRVAWTTARFTEEPYYFSLIACNLGMLLSPLLLARRGSTSVLARVLAMLLAVHAGGVWLRAEEFRHYLLSGYYLWALSFALPMLC